MGSLARIQVKEGDRVTAGQLLANLDDDVLQASLRMAEANLKSRGKLNSALAELRLQAERLENQGEAARRLPVVDRRFLSCLPFEGTTVLHPLPRIAARPG